MPVRLHPGEVINDLWYKNAIVYNLDVRTFMDSNGDGIGDFIGLTRRLDYLAGLGVTCIWLLPFYPSPCRDDGYDIVDYYGVDPRTGTLGDFVEFTHAARDRGIRVIVDFVCNHTSDEHPWFQAAKSDRKSKYRDWYVWSDTRPKEWNQGMVFPGVQKSTWSRDAAAGAWYFHRFYDFQPDLNTENPAVQAEIRKIMGFWLELGVSGFRVDAVPFVISKKGAGVKPHADYDMLRDLRAFLQWRRGDAILLAEANVTPDKDMQFFGDDGDRMHMMFNFQVNQHLFYALATGDVLPLVKAIHATQERPATAQWGLFLRNNDELDLGRLTKAQREKVFATFGPDKEMQLYDRGIRRRLATMLQGDVRRLELAYSLLFSLPGTPFLRYGDEIGMGDDLSLPERQCARTPMQWSGEKNGGFTAGRKPILPPIANGPYGYETLNAAAQRREPQSLMNWTERMIRMRKECPEIGWGLPRPLEVGDRSVLALRYDFRGTSVVTVHNLAQEPREIFLPIKDELVNLLSDAAPAARGNRQRVELEPYGYRWFRVGGLHEALEREPA